ncbi:hypothetical protein AZOA_32490 [Azoarcus sp. Aa7]|nr:hypothetical protein [Azoarcus sp. Aa7]
MSTAGERFPGGRRAAAPALPEAGDLAEEML